VNLEAVVAVVDVLWERYKQGAGSIYDRVSEAECMMNF
jgi:hypothetical protein